MKSSNQLLLSQIQKLKKIELHAHLFGSIRREELIKRMKFKGYFDQEKEFTKDLQLINFEVIFAKLFGHVERVIRTKSDLEWLIESVVQDFAQDNVTYLELRTGPKQLDDISEEEYLETVVKKFEELSSSEIDCQLILSLNRKFPPESQTKLFDLTRKINDKFGRIKGIDFSGDVRQGRFTDYLSILDEYQHRLGLGVTVHAPELIDYLAETQEILNYLPKKQGRIGHFLHYTENDLDTVKKKDLMVELCPTSNYVVDNLTSWEDHHMKALVEKGLENYTICTDDILLFDTSLSEEWVLAADCLNLDLQDIKEKIMKSVEFTFLSSVDKESLKVKLQLSN
jgi:adenosine deaminase